MSKSASSIASTFQFRSYKIDEFHFTMEKKVGTLGFMGCYDQDAWEPSIRINQPLFFVKEKYYVSSVSCKLTLKPEKLKDSPVIANLETGISGIFSTEGRFSPEQEKELVKTQMPAILLPYLRSGITAFLANAGFGSFIFPLINMQELARNALKDVEPLLVENK